MQFNENNKYKELLGLRNFDECFKMILAIR